MRILGTLAVLGLIAGAVEVRAEGGAETDLDAQAPTSMLTPELEYYEVHGACYNARVLMGHMFDTISSPVLLNWKYAGSIAEKCPDCDRNKSYLVIVDGKANILISDTTTLREIVMHCVGHIQHEGKDIPLDKLSSRFARGEAEFVADQILDGAMDASGPENE